MSLVNRLIGTAANLIIIDELAEQGQMFVDEHGNTIEVVMHMTNPNPEPEPALLTKLRPNCYRAGSRKKGGKIGWKRD